MEFMEVELAAASGGYGESAIAEMRARIRRPWRVLISAVALLP